MTPNQPKTASFDLDAVPTTEPIFDVAFASDEDGKPVYGFTVVGKNSANYQKASTAIRAAALRRASNRKSALDATTEQGSLAIAETIDKNELALATAVVVGWFGFGSGGQLVDFDAARVGPLLAKHPTWREKISAALEVDANFTTT
jgi:hypothetical protein